MTAPHTLHLIDRGSTFVVRGNAYPVLLAAGIKPYYVGAEARGFVVDRHKLADFCAYMDSRRVPYRIRRGDDA